MKLEVYIGGRARLVEITDAGNGPRFVLDGTWLNADVKEVSDGIYSVLFNGQSFEVSFEPDGGGLRVRTANNEWKAEVIDPRQWRRGRGSPAEAEGRQQVTVPMPGKVVRLLVMAGDTVEAGQGLMVVEAMKMQNEIRSPKSGTVERLFVSEGQAVNASEVLAIVV